MRAMTVIDDFLPNPKRYREEALSLEYRTFTFPEATFHGIALAPTTELPTAITNSLQRCSEPTLSFFRKSPEGQKEPHFIHTDVDMGDWSAILYLNENPPDGDGTSFWIYKPTGELKSMVPHERSAEGVEAANWEEWHHVESKFNRLVVFESPLFHSRSIYDNWGTGNDARLTHVVFGRGGNS